jgi:hypothetical protein
VADPTPSPVEAVPPPRATRVIRDLARAETALVQASLDSPGSLPPDELRRLRYLLSFARLTVFEPGAAGGGAPGSRPDLDVTDELTAFRDRVLAEVAAPLQAPLEPGTRLQAARAALGQIREALVERRVALLERHGGDCSAAELDAEVGTRVLVNVAGGGGGAGYVYLGAYERLDEAGLAPAFVIGSSIGALLGLFRARLATPPWEEYLALAKGLDRRVLFAPISLRRRFGLPGLLALDLRRSLDATFAGPDGEPLTLADLEVPYEAVVGGVLRRPFERLPQRFRASGETATFSDPASRTSPARLAPALALRMWQVAAFFDPRVVTPVILGGEPGTERVRALDAAGFSAAIPGVLHYDLATDDASPTAAALDELFETRELAALVDGGVVANVPAELAWRRVQSGKLGTRNALLLAFDCFHPQWDPRHLWLQPITQAIGLQMTRNALFADAVVRFEPTLSPLNLVPSPGSIDDTRAWGRASVESVLPLVQRLLEPVAWG